MADKGEGKGNIVVTGRGGSGKTSFTALTARSLIELGWSPLLLIDSDPDESLAPMVGVELVDEGKQTISEVFYDLVKSSETDEISTKVRIEPLVIKRSLFLDGGEFDFISLGPKWFEGCYCVPDRILGNIIESLSNNYSYTIIDSPAGVEHLNRRITKTVKDVFNILDPSKKSFDNAKRSHRIMKEVGIEFENYYLVGGYRFLDSLETIAEDQPFTYLGKIKYDDNVMKHNFEGRSLLQLSNKSPSLQSVKNILSKAGYERKPPSLLELLNI